MSDDYDVGYGKPPKHTQFQPGKSGNPNGRPKGTKNFATDLAEELSETIVVSEGDKQQKLSKQRAMIKSLTAMAMKGDARSIGIIIQQILHVEEANKSQTNAKSLRQDDIAIHFWHHNIKQDQIWFTLCA